MGASLEADTIGLNNEAGPVGKADMVPDHDGHTLDTSRCLAFVIQLLAVIVVHCSSTLLAFRRPRLVRLPAVGAEILP